MANIKFSQFTQKTTLGTVDFLVGYTGAQNIQIDPVDLLSAYPTGSGGTGRIAFWEPSNNLSSDYLFKWDNSSNRLGIGVETPTATLHVVTADDTIAKFVSSDNKAAISISDDDTTGYFSAENGRIGFGPGLGASSSNISIQTSNSNVGIGTVSPMAKLHVYGTLIATGISQLGSGGSNVLLTSSSGGNVGIGTSSPAEKLHVEGGNSYTPIRFDGNGNYSGYLYNDGGGIGIKDSSGTNIGNLIYLHTAGNNMRLYTSGSERIRIDSSGNVGIGTSSPTAKLHIQSSDNAATANLVYLENIGSGGSEGVSIKFNPMFNAESMIASNREGALANACNLTFHTYSNTTNEAMRITSAGNVGIGTTTPSGIFEVFEQGAGRTTGDLLVDATSNYVYVGRLSTTSGDVSSFKVRDRLNRAYLDVNTASKYISFSPETGNITMTLASGYGLGVGTTSPNARLNVISADETVARFERSSGSGFAAIDIKDSVGTSGNSAIRFSDTTATSGEINYEHADDSLRISTSSSEKMRITSAGNVGIGTTSPSAKLTVASGDVEVTLNTKGIILKSPDGTRYRITVANGGALTSTAI